MFNMREGGKDIGDKILTTPDLKELLATSLPGITQFMQHDLKTRYFSHHNKYASLYSYSIVNINKSTLLLTVLASCNLNIVVCLYPFLKGSY